MLRECPKFKPYSICMDIDLIAVKKMLFCIMFKGKRFYCGSNVSSF